MHRLSASIRPAAFVIALAMALAAPVWAQTPPEPEASRHSMWLVYSGDHSFADRVGLVFDTHLRLTADGDRQRQLLLRPGISFAMTERLKLSAGYTMTGARSDDNDPLTPSRLEHRAWVSAQLAHDLGPFALAHRYRAEHRWLPGVRVDDAGAPVGETYVTAERVRYSVRATIPLSGRGSPRGLTASVSEELFASFGGYAGDMSVDQNRAAIAIGVRFAPSLRMEVGYMLQSSAGDDGRLTERNHVLQLTAISSARFR
jgi:hypothetical protein